MIEIVFSVPIMEEPVSGDSKLLALIRVQDKNRTIIKRSWLSEFIPESRSVILAEDVEYIGRSGECVAGCNKAVLVTSHFSFGRIKDCNFARIRKGELDVFDLPAESILSLRDTKTGEILYQKQETPTY